MEVHDAGTCTRNPEICSDTRTGIDPRKNPWYRAERAGEPYGNSGVVSYKEPVDLACPESYIHSCHV
jgi:hypothetical protein